MSAGSARRVLVLLAAGSLALAAAATAADGQKTTAESASSAQAETGDAQPGGAEAFLKNLLKGQPKAADAWCQRALVNRQMEAWRNARRHDETAPDLPEGCDPDFAARLADCAASEPPTSSERDYMRYLRSCLASLAAAGAKPSL